MQVSPRNTTLRTRFSILEDVDIKVKANAVN